MHGIDRVDKDKYFTMNRYSATRGHSLKLLKKMPRLLVREIASQSELWTTGIG